MQILLIILALMTAFPAGYLLAWLCREELVSGRKYFISLILFSLLAGLVVAFTHLSRGLKISIILTCFYIAIVSLVSVYLSYQKKFVKN